MCFSLSFIENLLIQIVIVAVVVGILRLLVPWILGLLGFDMSVPMRIVNLLIAAVVIIWLIVLCFDLLGCIGGIGLPGRR
jgi:hypothetical protein